MIDPSSMSLSMSIIATKCVWFVYVFNNHSETIQLIRV